MDVIIGFIVGMKILRENVKIATKESLLAWTEAEYTMVTCVSYGI